MSKFNLVTKSRKIPAYYAKHDYTRRKSKMADQTKTKKILTFCLVYQDTFGTVLYLNVQLLLQSYSLDSLSATTHKHYTNTATFRIL